MFILFSDALQPDWMCQKNVWECAKEPFIHSVNNVTHVHHQDAIFDTFVKTVGGIVELIYGTVVGR